MTWNIFCPYCHATLDVTGEMLGHPVQCGGCAKVFPAPKEGIAPPSRYERRLDANRPEYVEDDPPDETEATPGRRPGSGAAVTSLILGIVALTVGTAVWFATFGCCPLVQTVLGALAVIIGFFGVKTEGKTMAIAGMVMGGIAMMLSILVSGMFGALIASMNTKPPPPTATATTPVPVQWTPPPQKTPGKLKK